MTPKVFRWKCFCLLFIDESSYCFFFFLFSRVNFFTSKNYYWTDTLIFMRRSKRENKSILFNFYSIICSRYNRDTFTIVFINNIVYEIYQQYAISLLFCIKNNSRKKNVKFLWNPFSFFQSVCFSLYFLSISFCLFLCFSLSVITNYMNLYLPMDII